MEWISISSGCFAVSNAVAQTDTALHAFVREVRESRADLDAISGELHSLSGVLDLLRDDADVFPAPLAAAAPLLLRDCCVVVAELGQYVSVLLSGSTSAGTGTSTSHADKRFRWAATRQHMTRLRWTLEGYKSALGLALDLVGMTSSTRIGAAAAAAAAAAGLQLDQTDEETQSAIDALAQDPEAKDELSRVLNEIHHFTTTKQHGDVRLGSIAYSLQTFLDALRTQADSIAAALGLDSQRPDEARKPSSSSSSSCSVGESPDSAIDVNDGEPPFFTAASKEPAHPAPASRPQSPLPPTIRLHLPIHEIDELLDELDELHDRSPPTPPPKALARMSSMRSAASAAVFDRSFTPTLPSRSEHRPSSRLSVACPPPAVPGRRSSLRTLNAWNPPLEHLYCGPESVYSVTTRITAENASAKPVASSSVRSTAGAKRSRVDRLFGHMRNALSDSSNNDDNDSGSNRRPSDSTTSDDKSLEVPALARRPSHTPSSSNRRLSLSIKNFSLWRSAPDTDDGDNPANPFTLHHQQQQQNAVFGVSLQKSIRLARGSARTRHTTGSGTSTRDFPLCVWKCYNYIKEEDDTDTDTASSSSPSSPPDGPPPPRRLGLAEPDIFGLDADAVQVQKLRDIFSAGPAYGADLDLPSAPYTVHDAAALLAHFLACLPKPLVPEAAAKRWIALSRQASQPGSHAARHEQCIDFWEEALEGVRGSPARSLLKLLLGLWGGIADRADENDMTAERLAGRLVGPLMQLPRGRYETDYMLALAFLIRKRSEYNMLLAGGGRKSNAAF